MRKKILGIQRTENLAAATDGQDCMAGRELDALVAERVMGWALVRVGNHTRWFKINMATSIACVLMISVVHLSVLGLHQPT